MEYFSQAKARFMAQSSHDFIQSLHSMSVFLEHLKPQVHGLADMKIFDRLKNAHRKLSESFYSMMDLSKLESGTTRRELEGRVSPNQQEAHELDENRPMVALVFQDGELRYTLAERLQKWRCPVLTFSSVEAAFQAGASPSVLLCEYPSLKSSSLSSEEAGALAQKTVAACTCDPGTPLPDNWIALPTAVLPPQLRALLNVAARRNWSSTFPHTGK